MYVTAIVIRIAGELYLAGTVIRDILRPWNDPVRPTASPTTRSAASSTRASTASHRIAWAPDVRAPPFVPHRA